MKVVLNFLTLVPFIAWWKPQPRALKLFLLPTKLPRVCSKLKRAILIKKFIELYIPFRMCTCTVFGWALDGIHWYTPLSLDLAFWISKYDVVMSPFSVITCSWYVRIEKKVFNLNGIHMWSMHTYRNTSPWWIIISWLSQRSDKNKKNI